MGVFTDIIWQKGKDQQIKLDKEMQNWFVVLRPKCEVWDAGGVLFSKNNPTRTIFILFLLSRGNC